MVCDTSFLALSSILEGIILLLAAGYTYYKLRNNKIMRFGYFLLFFTVYVGLDTFLFYYFKHCLNGASHTTYYNVGSLLFTVQFFFPCEVWVYSFTGLRGMYELKKERYPAWLVNVEYGVLVIYSLIILVAYVVAMVMYFDQQTMDILRTWLNFAFLLMTLTSVFIVAHFLC